MKEINLTKNMVALVDDEDYTPLSSYKWRALCIQGIWYALRSDLSSFLGKKNIFMHRQIMKAKKGEYVDHINHSGLDNRKGNLRLCTNSQNCSNTAKRSGTGYKGVAKTVLTKKYGQRWAAGITCDRVYYHLGVFDSPRKAAEAYDKKAVELFGEFAYTNKMLGLL